MRVRLNALLLLAVVAPALAKNIELPPNVTLRPGNMSGDYIDTFSSEVRGATFGKLKLCLAQNVSNPDLTLTGGANAVFDAKTQTSSVAGGGVFKYEDATLGIVIAVGSTDGGPTFMGLSREIIRFELVAEASAERTALKFTNISRADLNTGTATNQGFLPIGAWKGAKPLAVIETLQNLGSRIGSCLQ